MGKGYLIDSNAVIDFFNGTMNESGISFLSKIEANISIITQIEVLGFPGISASDERSIRDFLDNSIIYDVNAAIAKETIKLRSLNRIKLPDAIIAATTICYDLILITRNTNDFNKIRNIKLVNPYDV